MYYVMLYIEAAAEECSAIIEGEVAIDPRTGTHQTGAPGRNWQDGPAFASREGAEEYVRKWRQEMEADAFTWVGGNVCHSARF